MATSESATQIAADHLHTLPTTRRDQACGSVAGSSGSTGEHVQQNPPDQLPGQCPAGSRPRQPHRLPDGRVLFVELAVGPDKLLLSEEIPELNAVAPPLGGSPVMLLLELEDVDSVLTHAIEMGATVEMPVAEMFWGERYGLVRDPFGHHWAYAPAASFSPRGGRRTHPRATNRRTLDRTV